jgi:hypothetical protein
MYFVLAYWKKRKEKEKTFQTKPNQKKKNQFTIIFAWSYWMGGG